MADQQNDKARYLAPGSYLDSDHPAIQAFVEETVGDIADPTQKALKLYYTIRDGIRYHVYLDYTDPKTYRASDCLIDKKGFCVGKAALMAAAARAAGIPARVGYADVKNHLASEKLRKAMGTDLFYWHGYAELFLDGHWVKATPAFDKALCEKFGVIALDFDGKEDSLFQPYDRKNRRHMEYMNDRGTYDDVPAQEIIDDFDRYYPDLGNYAATHKGDSLHDEAGDSVADKTG
jgi:transglutaminase-like putative cysteine protease